MRVLQLVSLNELRICCEQSLESGVYRFVPMLQDRANLDGLILISSLSQFESQVNFEPRVVFAFSAQESRVTGDRVPLLGLWELRSPADESDFFEA